MTIATKKFLSLLKEWSALREQMLAFAPTVEKEIQVRKELFALAFPVPKEGTNTEDLPNGWKIKGIYRLDRKLDEAALPAVFEQLRNQNVNPDPLVKWKPELVTGDYKALSPANKATFDQALTTKPASPTVELIPPKEKA